MPSRPSTTHETTCDPAATLYPPLVLDTGAARLRGGEESLEARLRAHLGLLPRRAKFLVVVRESTMHDDLLLEGMLHHSLAFCDDIDGIEEVRAAGLEPLRGRSPFPVVRFRTRDQRACLFAHGDAYFLISAGSAAKVDARGDNDFISLLCDVLELLEPIEMRAATMGRLIRLPEFGGKLLGATSRNVDIVRLGPVVLSMKDPYGKLQWQTLGMVSAMERDLIVQRMQVGKINAWRRNEWPFGGSLIPVGYMLDGKTLVPDPAMQPTVLRMLEVLAADGFSKWAAMDQLGRLGVSTPRLRAMYGEDATVADAATPSSVVNGLLHWAELYASGEYTMLLPNEFLLDEVAGIKIVGKERESSPRGYVPLRYVPGTPDGGWAPVDLCDAVVLRKQKWIAGRGRTGHSAARQRLPLQGLVDRHDPQYEYRLSSNQTANGYHVHRYRHPAA